MKVFPVLAVTVLLMLTACSESDNYLPTLKDSWMITVESHERVGGIDYPLSFEVTLAVERISTSGSGPAPDGTPVSVTVLFPDTGAQQSLEIATLDGLAVIELVFEQPGVAECTADVGAAHVVFEIWVLENGDSGIAA